MITTTLEAGKFIYSSFMTAKEFNRTIIKDEKRRNPQFTSELLKLMGSPDEHGVNILVTGSKGKGSLSIILNALLTELGYTVGLFTGPHLVDFNERIRVNNEMIPDDDLIRITNLVEPTVNSMQTKLKPGEYIGPVGILAVMAALYFKEKKTDFNIIECGKGARFDDVARLKADISLVNSIFLEHTEELGDTISEIAYHKAGVINTGHRGVFAGMQPYGEALDVLSHEASACGVPIFAYGRDYSAENICINLKSTSFIYKNKNLEISLCGEHQAYNAVTAISATEYLLGKELDFDTLSKALKKVRWPGRMDIISEEPLIILDGCINRMSADYVVKYLSCSDKHPDCIVLSIPDDKDSEGVIEALKHFTNKMVLTVANNPNLKYSKNIQYENAIKILGEDKTIFIRNSEEAINYAVSETKNMLCILGTISLIRDALIWKNR